MVVTIAGIYFCYRLTTPFFSVFTWALELAIMFAPLYRRLERKVKYPNLAASMWGTVVVGWIDNLLYPMLVGSRLKIHTIVAFISIVGGLIVFGPSGLILGPVIFTITRVLLEIWRNKIQPGRQKTRLNKVFRSKRRGIQTEEIQADLSIVITHLYSRENQSADSATSATAIAAVTLSISSCTSQYSLHSLVAVGSSAQLQPPSTP